MHRALVLAFSVLAYAVFLVTFLYLIAFVGNLQLTPLADALPRLRDAVPRSIDAGGAQEAAVVAIAVDLGLILIFGLQHSLMARSGFKAWLKRHLPAAAERSLYVLLASLVLTVLFWQWRPLPAAIWTFDSAIARTLAWSVFGAGFGLVLVSTFLIDHFDLFGLRPAWLNFTGRTPAVATLRTPLFYRVVRHPIYLGFMLAFWGTPEMSAGHLLFASAMSVYIAIAIPLEERDLLRQLGDDYARYRMRVAMLVPWVRRSRPHPDLAADRRT
jgi:protein-S-isoprenylcysteine O-methyltransferase Ste14